MVLVALPHVGSSWSRNFESYSLYSEVLGAYKAFTLVEGTNELNECDRFRLHGEMTRDWIATLDWKIKGRPLRGRLLS